MSKTTIRQWLDSWIIPNETTASGSGPTEVRDIVIRRPARSLSDRMAVLPRLP
jgi:hypothetical protein